MVKILNAVLIINALSFTIMRIYWYLTNKLSAEIVIPRRKLRAEDDSELIILAAGCAAQPREAFRFLEPHFGRKQFMYLNFRMIGWSAKSTAKKVVESVWPTVEVTMYAISVGDQIARRLEKSALQDRLQVCTINPCSNWLALRFVLRLCMPIVVPIAWVLCHALGWLSVIPFIPATGSKYSIILLLDQYMTIAFGAQPVRHNHRRTRGVVLSMRDEFLNNEYLKQAFDGVKMESTSTKHGRTAGEPKEYLYAIERLLANQDK